MAEPRRQPARPDRRRLTHRTTAIVALVRWTAASREQNENRRGGLLAASGDSHLLAGAGQFRVTAGQRGSGSHGYQVADREVVEGDLGGRDGQLHAAEALREPVRASHEPVHGVAAVEVVDPVHGVVVVAAVRVGARSS